ncbi:hypothetical protein K227x_28240 [Rubripirellula lacrimiformis]|uniref:Tetratricopeptide repeat protein n=1 Tax=Rubripirellula lacrimiformis TaxID=1930273 RepID=A0A517NBD2_9BACT|nr:tetratricopeptide repeat protein [Rubripirellula lacrimiformis]QDT04433.1 hypothetical protein K227x_28240 [Rubripirellula lacrimiformis]
MRARSKTHSSQPQQATAAKTSDPRSIAPPIVHSNPVLDRTYRLMHRGDYQAAMGILQSAGRDPSIRNALGVCLLRLGRPADAVAVFRQFVLAPGSVSERSDLSKHYKRNFALALLMNGSPSGALDVLRETRQPDHPAAIRIRDTVKQWEKTLSWLRRLDWKLNRIEPSNCQVPIDFEPGELEDSGLEVHQGQESELVDDERKVRRRKHAKREDAGTGHQEQQRQRNVNPTFRATGPATEAGNRTSDDVAGPTLSV